MSSQGGGYRFLEVCEWFLISAMLILPALLKAPAGALPGWLTPFKGWIIYIQGVTWILLLAAAVLLVIVRFAKGKVGDRWIVEMVRDVLTRLRDAAVSRDCRQDPLHYHRVTLFRYRQLWWRCWRRWPWTGWLIPIARSAHTTQRVKSVFRVPDDADNAEGIAGMAWTSQAAVVVSDLPDLHGPKVSDADFDLYARKTKISEKTARETMPHSRSFMGWPVRVRGHEWGVIVIDSRNPNFTRRASVDRMYDAVAGSLQKCLERLS